MEKYETIAKCLQDALNSEPINTTFLINTIKHSDNLDRQFIRESYYKLTNIELIEDLKSLRTIEGKSFECLLIALFRSPTEYDVYEISEAVDGVGTNEDVLSEILGTRDPHRIQEIKKFYSVFFFNKLEDIIKGEIKEEGSSSHYLDFLGKILENKKMANSQNSPNSQMTKDIHFLNNLKDLNKGGQIELFSRLLLKENPEYLKGISESIRDLYFKKNGKNISLDIENPLGNLFISAIKGQTDFIRYYGERFFSALKGAKKDNKRIVRSLMSVYPVNMTALREFIESEYMVSMDNLITENTKGLFRELLIVVANSDNVMKHGIEITTL